MCKTFSFLMLASIIMLFSLVSAAFADNNVSIQFNGGGAFNKVYLNETNILQIVIANDNNLAGAISLGFEFTWDPALTVVWDPSHTNEPAMWDYLREENDAVGVWNLPWLSVSTRGMDNTSPDSLLLGGSNLGGPGLPANPTGRVCYSLAFDASGSEALGGFCVDNIFFPPGGGWIFNESTSGFPPDFQGNPNSSTGNPDAPAVCFDIGWRDFLAGDADSSGMVDISDAVYLQTYIFRGGTAPMPMDAGDADCSGSIDISDTVYIIRYIFGGGLVPCYP